MSALRVATYLAPALRPVYERVAAAMSDGIGSPAELQESEDLEALASGGVDVAFVCGLPYVRLAEHLHLLGAPVLMGERYGGRPVYFSDVIVRREDPAQSFLDLRGRSWAYNEPNSHSGYNVTRAHLVSLGRTDGFFAQVQAAGSHAECVRRVVEGEADAAAIDSQVLTVELGEQPGLQERLRVIESLGPSPIQPVVASRRLAPEVRSNLRLALLDLDGDPVLARGLVERFVDVDDSHYEAIRASLRACREARFMELL